MANKPEESTCCCNNRMGFWDWAHKHPVALCVMVIFGIMGLVSIFEAVFY